MHRYRLRYIVFGLLIYIQSAFCLSCGSEFDDVAARTYHAGIVFEGNIKEKYETYSVPRGYYNATFRVRNVLKGDLPREMATDRYKVILVGVFGTDAEPEKCIGSVEVGQRYLLFLQGGSGNSMDPSVPFYNISAMPVVGDKINKRLVRKYKCSKCGKFNRVKRVISSAVH